MADAHAGKLSGKNILVVEDEYLLARHVADMLRTAGISVLGPVPSVKAALALVEETPAIDGAVLDVNLRNERVYPVADALLARGVPIVFATGYEELLLDRRYVTLPRSLKPIDREELIGLLASIVR